MKVRVTYVVDKGNHIGLVKQAIEGEVIECDRVTFDHGVLILWQNANDPYNPGHEGKEPIWVLMKAYGPGTYRTVVPLPVGAGDQPQQATDENPPGRSKAAP